jgi:hypothetical protein
MLINVNTVHGFFCSSSQPVDQFGAWGLACLACATSAVRRSLDMADLTTLQLPSGYVNSLLLKTAIQCVDLPIKNGDFPVRYVNVYQRVWF